MSVAAGAVGTLVGSDRALCPVPGRLTSGRSASAARAPSTRSGPARRTRCTGSRENQRQRGAGRAPSGNRSSTRVPISPSGGSHSHTAGQASHAAALRRGGSAGTDPPQSRSSARSTRSPPPAVASPRRCPGGAGLAGPDDREARRHQGQRGRGGDGRRPGGVQDRHDRDADTSGQVLTSSPHAAVWFTSPPGQATDGWPVSGMSISPPSGTHPHSQPTTREWITIKVP